MNTLTLFNDAPTTNDRARYAHLQRTSIQVGDATNFVVVFAGELLSKAEHLIRMGLHPADVIEGYEKASKKALELIEGIALDNVKDAKDAKELAKVGLMACCIVLL